MLQSLSRHMRCTLTRPATIAGLVVALAVFCSGMSTAWRTQTVVEAGHIDQAPHIRNVAVGQSPGPIAVDTRTGRVFVVNRGPLDSGYGGSGNPLGASAGSVSVLDATTGQVLRTQPVGRGPTLIAVDERLGRVFVVNRGPFDPGTHAFSAHSTVSILDAATGQLLHTARLSTPAAMLILVDQGRGRVVIVGLYDIEILDALTGVVVRRLHEFAEFAALDARADRLFLGDEGAVRTFREMTGARIATATINDGTAASDERPFVNALAVDEQAGHVIVSGGNDRSDLTTTRLLDARTGAQLHREDGQSAAGAAIGVDEAAVRAIIVRYPAGYESYYGNTGSDVAEVVDTRSGHIVASRDIPAFRRVTLTVDQGQARAYLALQPPIGHANDPGQVVVLDTRTGRTIRQVMIGKTAAGIAVDPLAGLVFVTDESAGVVNILTR